MRFSFRQAAPFSRSHGTPKSCAHSYASQAHSSPAVSVPLHPSSFKYPNGSLANRNQFSLDDLSLLPHSFIAVNTAQIDWSGIKVMAIALNSVRLAAIEVSSNLPPDEQKRFVERVNKRAYRERWLDKAKAISKPRDNGSALPLSKPVQTGESALASRLQGFKRRSLDALAEYSAMASEEALKSKSKLAISRKVKDVADVHKTLWPIENQDQNILQVAILVQS